MYYITNNIRLNIIFGKNIDDDIKWLNKLDIDINKFKQFVDLAKECY